MIAKVEPLTQARALRGPFDYRLPAAMADVGIGSMLEVPFGRQRLLGVVVELAEQSDVPPERLVEPLAALESGVPPDLVRLGLWVAEEYCSTPARGLALVLPPGTGTGRSRAARIRTTLEAALTEEGRRALGGAAEPANGSRQGVRLGARQRAALEALERGVLPVAEAAQAAGCGHATFRSLEAHGLVTVAPVEVRRRPQLAGVGARGRAGRELTAAQRAALTEICRLMDEPDAGPGEPAAGRPPAPCDRRLLLHGVTGSGKTEVYLRAAAAALERGRSAIVLVPEIALTPQTAGRFEERFGDGVAILHSQLAAGERHDEWLRLRRGEARVCVGPRSAVFAPLADVGLIVVDEEHDASYKQEGDPRYDARRVAERRAADCGAVIVSGTATPRPESWRRLPRVSLSERVDGRPLPPVEVVGMAGVAGALHPATRAALDCIRDQREKAIVLLNRRGWSNFLTCRGCGRAWECPHCDVTLVLHRAHGSLACHHCGHSQRVPASCCECGSVSVARHGAGTERLERELEELMASVPVLRLDSDMAAGRGAIAELLGRFDAAPSAVLVGTQMVAKGHDFPDVTLGVVLDADSTMRFPDFRAEERTFALVAQLAGRSGRGPRGGRVIVQALDASARPLRYAARHHAAGFLEEELERRELLRYPPFSSLIRVVCSSEEAGEEHQAARAVAEALGPLEGAALLGPAPLFRLKGRLRAQLVLKAGGGEAGRARAVAAVRAAVEAVSAGRSRRGVSFSVDVDPQ